MVRLGYTPILSFENYHIFVSYNRKGYAMVYFDGRTIFPYKYDTADELLTELFNLPIPGIVDKTVEILRRLGLI